MIATLLGVLFAAVVQAVPAGGEQPELLALCALQLLPGHPAGHPADSAGPRGAHLQPLQRRRPRVPGRLLQHRLPLYLCLLPLWLRLMPARKGAPAARGGRRSGRTSSVLGEGERL